MSPIVRRSALIATAAVVVLLGLAGAWIAHFRVQAPAIHYPKPSSALEAQRQDLDYFARLLALDRSFTPRRRAAAERRLAALENLSSALPVPKLQTALMQIVALADNGHSRVDPIRDKGTLWTEPFRVTRFVEGFYVMRATAPYRDLLGGRIESIDGMAFDRVLTLLETLRGGTEGLRRETAATLIALPDMLYGLGIATEPRTSDWTVRLPDGRLITRTVAAVPLAKRDLAPDERWLSPQPLKRIADWISYTPASGVLPESLTDDDNHFALFPVAGTCAAAVRLQSIADADGQRIRPFLQSAQAALAKSKPCAIILDLRGNGGGDYTNTWGFTHALPHLTAGPIYILTDPQTFSAAITTAGFTMNAAGKRVTIVGEPVGDRLAFYSEGRSGCLPNSGICVAFQLARHDYGRPCLGWNCFWVDWLFPVRVRTFRPQVLIPRRFSDWNGGHDAAYEWCVSAIEASGSRSRPAAATPPRPATPAPLAMNRRGRPDPTPWPRWPS